jgi:pyruvate/2-oxoglutarate dehydrogenase complex dihydrolipoamide dehydrogenase (E3) component
MDLLRHHGVDIYLGEAEVVESGIIKVRAGKLDFDGEQMHYSGEDIEIAGEHIILATGSKPLIPGFIDPKNPFIVSSNRLIAIGELPETLVIVGGGVIGIEFATIFSNLGSKVTIIELMDRILAGMDAEVSAEITRLMEANGVAILAGHEVKSIDQGVIRVTSAESGETFEIESKAILIAVGRQAVINEEMLQKLNPECVGDWRRHRKIDPGACGHSAGPGLRRKCHAPARRTAARDGLRGRTGRGLFHSRNRQCGQRAAKFARRVGVQSAFCGQPARQDRGVR